MTLSAAESRLWAGPLLEPVQPPVRPDRKPSDQKQKRKPIALVSTLPDPAPLRWAMSTDEIEELDPRLGAPCWTSDCGADRTDTQSPPPANADACALNARRLAPETIMPRRHTQRRVADRLLTSICRTGPPQA